MSGIPGSVGGATAININAYGQSLAELSTGLKSTVVNRLKLRNMFSELPTGATKSLLTAAVRTSFCKLPSAANQTDSRPQLPNSLGLRQSTRIWSDRFAESPEDYFGTRALAGSLLDQSPAGRAKTCGSFFRNPLVDKKQIEHLISFDETGFSQEKLKAMNRLHGGQTNRISARSRLAGGWFFSGQTFGRVRLHPSHVLKLRIIAKRKRLKFMK